MKKQLTTVLLILALLMTMTGCSVAGTARKLDAAEDKVEAKLDAAEEKVEDALRDAVAPASPATPAPPAANGTAQLLTAEQAQQIALDHAGFTADQVTRLRTEYEIDDGIPQFSVEFQEGDWEYEYEIHGETGSILSFDKDSKYD